MGKTSVMQSGFTASEIVKQYKLTVNSSHPQTLRVADGK